jgi:hypothetical protein
MQEADRLASLESRLQHSMREVLHDIGGRNISITNVSVEDVYYYCCALVDRCLAQHQVPVLGDDHRLEVLRGLANVNAAFMPVYGALRNLNLGYRLRLQRRRPPATSLVLTNYPQLLNNVISAVDAVCPPPQASS